MSTIVSPREFVNAVPMLRAAVLMVVGVVVGDCLGAADLLVGAMGVFVALLGVAVVADKRFPYLSGVLLLCCIVAVGTVRLGIGEYGRVDMPVDTDGSSGFSRQSVRYQGQDIVVVSKPEIHGKTLQLDAEVCSDGVLKGKKLRVSVLRDSLSDAGVLTIGSMLEAEMMCSGFKDQRSGTGRFDYKRWMESRGFAGRAFVGKGGWRLTERSHEKVGWITRYRIFNQRLRDRIVTEIERVAGSDLDLSVALAMSVGDKSHLSSGVREAYSKSGAAHVLAISGMHLGIIYALLLMLIGNGYRLAHCLVLAMLWMYVFFVGSPVSVVRATTMLTIWGVIVMTGRRQHPLNVLGLAVCVLVMINPLCVWDVGFQLSVASVFAIVVIVPFINAQQPASIAFVNKMYEQRLPASQRMGRRLARLMWTACGVAIAAQIGTMPLSAYYFGRVPCYFLLSNIIVLLFVYAVVVLTLVTVVFCAAELASLGACGMLTKACATVTGVIAGWMTQSLTFVASLPGASIEGIDVPAWIVGVIYVLLFCLCWIVKLLSVRMPESSDTVG